MNNKELQALRKLFMLDVSEAAAHIGKVSARTWQYWESGRYNIPDDVENEMLALADIRDQLIEDIAPKALQEEITVPYYISFEEYSAQAPEEHRSVIGWRLRQSVAAVLFDDGARLV